MRMLTALAVWIAAVAAAAGLSSAVASSIHRPAPTVTTSTGSSTGSTPAPATPTPTPPFDPASVKPTDPRSLFVGSNFQRVLAITQRHLGARAYIERAELMPAQLELTVLIKNQNRAITIRVNGQYISSYDGPAAGSTQVFALGQIHANVPAALARRISAHGRVPVSHLNYMLIETDPRSQSIFWAVYPSLPTGIYFRCAGATGPIEEIGGPRTLTIR